jgi:hypothetical protein
MPNPPYYYRLDQREKHFHNYSVKQLIGLEEMINRSDEERDYQREGLRKYVDEYQEQYGWRPTNHNIRTFRMLLSEKGPFFYAGWRPEEIVKRTFPR